MRNQKLAGLLLAPLLASLLASLPQGVTATPASTGQHVLQADAPIPPSLSLSQPDAPTTRKLRGKFLHITDLHPDAYYKIHSSTEEGIACHRGKGPAGTYGAETSDCDSPFSLINATFDWIEANIKDDLDFVVWTGDSARHDSDEEIPRSPAQVLGTNRWIADKFTALFADPNDPRKLTIPIIPTLGNNDILPHNILLPGPNKWLQYYTDVWRAFIPEEQRHSFEFGGWFYVEAIPNKLAVFSLNTLYFFDRNAGVDDCAQPSEPGFKQMEWLDVQLAFLRSRGMKAILMGHVPPARTDSKQNWDETCWQKYTLWLQQYRDVVVGSIYGHMNIDHFFVHDTKEVNINLLVDESQAPQFSTRETMEDEMSVESTADYLLELRKRWASLPKPVLKTFDDSLATESQKKKKKPGNPFKDLGGKYAERFQISIIGPSVVPNYFPTIRVIEYNITGMENVPAWSDLRDFASNGPTDHPILSEDPDKDEELQSEVVMAKRKKKAGKKKPKKPKDPNLVVPEPPTKGTPPGPAYSPQPLTFTGYTQLFANLTYINNDMTHDEDDGKGSEEDGDGASADRWRDGVHKDKKPKSKKPKPKPFVYEIGYSTFNDTTYKLRDLTVKSYLQLAYRMGQRTAQAKELVGDFEEIDELDPDPIEDDNTSLDDVDVDDVAAQGVLDDEASNSLGKKQGKKGKKGKKGKGGKGGDKKKKKRNKVWLEFLSRAFVFTVDKKELKNLSN